MSMLAPILFSYASLATHEHYQGVSPWLVALFVVLSCMFGDTVDYLTGRYLEWLLERWPRLNQNKVQSSIHKGEELFQRFGPFAIVLMSCIPVFHSAVSMSAGATKFAYPKFITINTGTNIIIVLACLFFGHFFGQLPFVKDHLLLMSFSMMLLLMIPVLLLSRHLQSKK